MPRTKSERRDNWSLVYNGVSIWSYFRTKYHNQVITGYQPPLRVGWSDLSALFVFLTLRMRPQKIVVACLNRPDVLAFVRSTLQPESYILFLRSEGYGGNSALIEAIRFISRKLVMFSSKKSIDDINKQLLHFDKSFPWCKRDISDAVGDYHFNKFLFFFLKKKKIYYTNCIIPRIERHMGLHDSIELQHGIIHKDHLDYAKIPNTVIKNKLIVWDEFWKSRLTNEFKYGGAVLCSEFNFRSNSKPKKMDHNVVIYSTVSQNISRIIESYAPNYTVALQLHPRDYYKYTKLHSNYKLVRNTSPSNIRYAIVNDSTLILGFIANGIFFIYLSSFDESPDEIRSRLNEKYCATIHDNYEIAFTVGEALKRIQEHSLRILD